MKKKIILNLLLVISVFGILSCKKDGESKENSNKIIVEGFKRNFTSIALADYSDTTFTILNSFVSVYSNISDYDNNVNALASGFTNSSGEFLFNTSSTKKAKNSTKDYGTSDYYVKVVNDSMSTLSTNLQGLRNTINISNNYIDLVSSKSISLLPKLTNLNLKIVNTSSVPLQDYTVKIFYSYKDYNNYDTPANNDYFGYSFPSSLQYLIVGSRVSDGSGDVTFKVESLRPYWFKVYDGSNSLKTTNIFNTSKLLPTASNDLTIQVN